jgi:hypothetical protein
VPDEGPRDLFLIGAISRADGDCEDSATISQFRLNKLFTSCPEMISAKDNLVGGAVVAGLPDDPAAALAEAVCLSATLGPCRPITFRFLRSTLVTAGGGAVEAYDLGVGGGSLAAASVNSVGGGTIVGWLVSMMIRSGGC